MEDSENKLIEDKLPNLIYLAKRVLSAVDEAISVLEKWFEIEKRINQLSFMLKTLLRFITTSAKKSLYLRPVDRILEEVEGILKHALDTANKFNLKSVFRWFFNTTKTTDFQTLFRNLDDSIGNMKWLLTVYDPKNNGAFGGIVVFLPPIVNNNPIFLLVWSCIATIQMGRRLSDRIDAIQSLDSLAQDSNLYKKYIVEERGVPPLLKLLEETASLYAQIAAADALCTLTNDPEIMKNIVIVIVRLLKDAPIEIQIKAVNLVVTLAELKAATEYDSAEGNVIWPLVTLLSSEASADDPEIKLGKRQLKISCAEALWTLAARSVSNCRTITKTKAMLCLAKLVEKERGKLKYYCLMTIKEITAAAESDSNFRRAVFKTNSPSAKAVVDQLLRVIKESDDPIMQIPAIRSVGSLARIFSSRETRVIGPLASLLYNRHLTVATEADIALKKFTSAENYLSKHWKSVIEPISSPASMRLTGGGNEMKRHRWVLLIDIDVFRFARESSLLFAVNLTVTTSPSNKIQGYYTLILTAQHAIRRIKIILQYFLQNVVKKAWGIGMDGLCTLCKQEQETRDHLFFACSYSKAIWRRVLSLCGLNREVISWIGELAWAVKKLKGKALITKLLKVGWSAFIYEIWRERNRRVFEQKEEDPEFVLEKIKKTIRYRLAGLKKVAADSVNISLRDSWGLFDTIFE